MFKIEMPTYPRTVYTTVRNKLAGITGASLNSFSSWLFRVLRLELLLTLYFCFKFHRRLYVFFRTLPRDIRFLNIFYNVKQKALAQASRNESIYSAFERLVNRQPDSICFLSYERSWTYKEVSTMTDAVAQMLSAAGYKRGDIIAFMMGNRVEGLCIRLGMAQLGVIAALININLRGRQFEHTVVSVSAKAIIYDGEFADVVEESRTSGRLPGIATFYQFDGELKPQSEDLKALINAAPPGRPVVDDPPGYEDVAVYIYTSGTSGLPKACIITHAKMLLGPIVFEAVMNLKPEKDVMYMCMPLYHMAGGGYGAGVATVVGVPVAIVPKFSARRFWTDCIKFKATASQYIGEMCRFLMSQPPHESDRAHQVRVMCGNGLRPNVWRPFQKRFNVSRIIELYGSTEGNVNLANWVDGTVGAVGFLPRCVPLSWSPLAIVRVNQETEELLRGEDGLCQRCDEGEIGMIVGRISNDDASRDFKGYVDKEASNKKIARNVFKRGDKWFVSGDLLTMDEFGYLYFKDRVGDTFRWKGENVATAEIENIFKTIMPAHDIAVYGVQIPDTEGRCGMAAIEDPEGTVDQKKLDDLAEGIIKSIPAYAQPLFVRIIPRLPVNGTFKVLKNVLQKDGYDPQKVSDPLYFLDPKTKRYVRLTNDIINDLNAGLIRV